MSRWWARSWRERKKDGRILVRPFIVSPALDGIVTENSAGSHAYILHGEVAKIECWQIIPHIACLVSKSLARTIPCAAFVTPTLCRVVIKDHAIGRISITISETFHCAARAQLNIW